MKIDVLFTDVDGVLTDGKYYGIDGDIQYKKFNDNDFTAIKLFKKIGIPVIWISGDRSINEIIAKKMSIDFIYAHAEKLKAIRDRYPDLNKVVYVGDDFYDIPVLEKVGYPFCPSNAFRDPGYDWESRV